MSCPARSVHHHTSVGLRRALFMARARLSWASREMDPELMAPCRSASQSQRQPPPPPGARGPPGARLELEQAPQVAALVQAVRWCPRTPLQASGRAGLRGLLQLRDRHGVVQMHLALLPPAVQQQVHSSHHSVLYTVHSSTGRCRVHSTPWVHTGHFPSSSVAPPQASGTPQALALPGAYNPRAPETADTALSSGRPVAAGGVPVVVPRCWGGRAPRRRRRAGCCAGGSPCRAARWRPRPCAGSPRPGCATACPRSSAR